MKYLITVPALCLSLALISALQADPVRAKNYPVNTTLAGVEIRTTVDSAIARQVLSGSGSGSELSPADITRLDSRLSCPATDQLPDAESLQRLSRDYSPDTAMALLVRCLLDVPQIRRSQELFLSELALQRREDTAQALYLGARTEQYTILFVPGWDYLSNGGETGGDLALPRQLISKLGYNTHLVPIEENGSVERNAQILTQTLQAHFQLHKNIILVSASSGGPTVALALSTPAIGEHPLLTGWLNICGVLRGSPVIDYFAPWPKSWLLHIAALVEGWDYQNLQSLSRARSQQRYDRFIPPPQLTIVNYIGTPLSGQISRFGKTFYGLLKTTGPNDGLTLITDALAPGYTILAVGSDHFVMEDPDISDKTAALLPVMLKLMEEQPL
jgi:hypothetical protein